LNFLDRISADAKPPPPPHDWIEVSSSRIEFVTPKPKRAVASWSHPPSEAERLAELEGFLAADFDTIREVPIRHRGNGEFGLFDMRIDLLAVPKFEVAAVADLVDLGMADVALAFEVKRQRFDVERALKQSADYVGGRVLEGPHRGKRIAACFLYPVADFDHADSKGRDRYHAGMFNLIAQWRVGRGFVSSVGELVLALGFVVIWRSRRGWVASKARDMLLGKRSIGGKRKALPEEPPTAPGKFVRRF
jgi:hypothetical protein